MQVPVGYLHGPPGLAHRIYLGGTLFLDKKMMDGFAYVELTIGKAPVVTVSNRETMSRNIVRGI